MGVVKLPMVKWSSKSSRANIVKSGLEGRGTEPAKADDDQHQFRHGFQHADEIVSKQKQIKVYENDIIPALRRNFQSLLLAYEQNTEELFTLYDAWETLNLTQLE